MKHLKKAFCLLLAAVMLLALGVPVMAAGEIPVDAEHFPDATLRTYVTDYCDTNKDNKLSAAECAAVQCIDLFEMQITKVADMTGIEHFTNLRELLACNNQITTLDLSGMTKLEKLDVSGCDKLQSLKLAGCTALTSLDASSCALTALDLTGCTALKTVACSYNDLTALDVSAAEKLTTLECSANRLTALDLSGHKALKVLTCSLNDLAALELTGCTALESLDCSDNALAALDLSGCTALNATAQGDGKTANPILSPQYLPEQTGAVTDGQQCTVYLDAIVGKDNIGSVARVPDANYDKQTSAAVYAKTPDYFTYQYDTGRKGLPSMAVYFEMQNMTTGVALDEATFPDAAFRTLLAETDTGHVQTLPGSYALTGTENGVGLFDLSQIVGKNNIGSITAVKGASYDKETGIARYSAAVEKPSYTYATGSSAVSLTVSFSLDMSTLPKSPFTDVVAGSWYFDAALYASSHNLMLGTSPTEFSPNITMTRGMLVTVLYRMNGSPSVSGKTPFTDVRTDEWYSAAVLWAYQNGIVTGMSDTTFAPINNVTREQMATILFRYTKTAAPDKAKASADLSGFADAGSVNDWAVDAMRWAVGQKLIAGITLEQSVYLQPRGNATRAQAATVLTRYYAQ